jgi:transposase
LTYLTAFWEAARRKHPEIWRTNDWFLLHENAAAHRSVLVKDFLAKNNLTALEHPLYSPDLASADLFSVFSTEINIEGTVRL